MSVSLDPTRLIGKSCLVVGGGAIASRVLGPLLGTGICLTVVSPTLAPALLEVARDGRLRWWPREYARGDVAGFALAIVATDDDSVNAQVTAEALERSVEVIGDRLAARPAGPEPATPATGRGGRRPAAPRSRGAPAPRSSSGASRAGSAGGSGRRGAG